MVLSPSYSSDYYKKLACVAMGYHSELGIKSLAKIELAIIFLYGKKFENHFGKHTHKSYLETNSLFALKTDNKNILKI